MLCLEMYMRHLHKPFSSIAPASPTLFLKAVSPYSVNKAHNGYYPEMFHCPGRGRRQMFFSFLRFKRMVMTFNHKQPLGTCLTKHILHSPKSF